MKAWKHSWEGPVGRESRQNDSPLGKMTPRIGGEKEARAHGQCLLEILRMLSRKMSEQLWYPRYLFLISQPVFKSRISHIFSI